MHSDLACPADTRDWFWELEGWRGGLLGCSVARSVADPHARPLVRAPPQLAISITWPAAAKLEGMDGGQGSVELPGGSAVLTGTQPSLWIPAFVLANVVAFMFFGHMWCLLNPHLVAAAWRKLKRTRSQAAAPEPQRPHKASLDPQQPQFSAPGSEVVSEADAEAAGGPASRPDSAIIRKASTLVAPVVLQWCNIGCAYR